MTDEYLKDIMNREPKDTLILPTRERQGSYHGMPVYIDETLTRGTLEIRNEEGKVLARLHDGQNIAIEVNRS